MRTLKRVLFLTLLIGANAVPFVSSAYAENWNIEELHYDAEGNLVGATCDECWFWDCDCEQAQE